MYNVTQPSINIYMNTFSVNVVVMLKHFILPSLGNVFCFDSGDYLVMVGICSKVSRVVRSATQNKHRLTIW